MKYLQTYEQLNIKNPKIGDYVLCDEQDFTDEQVKKFITKNIGECVHILPYTGEDDYDYLIRYENIPDELNNEFSPLINWCGILTLSYKYNAKENKNRAFKRSEIKFFSPNKKKVEKYAELYNSINKFNI